MSKYTSKVGQMVTKLLSNLDEMHNPAGEIGTEKLTVTYLRNSPGQKAISKTIAAIVSRGKKLPPGHTVRTENPMVKRSNVVAAPNELNKHIKRNKQVFTRFHDVAEGAPNSVQKADSDITLGTVYPKGKGEGKNKKDGSFNLATKESAAKEKAEDERRNARGAGGGDDQST